MKNWFSVLRSPFSVLRSPDGLYSLTLITFIILTIAFTALSLTGCRTPTDPPAPILTGISAAFNSGTAAIYPTTPFNDLKAHLTVTAQYSDNSSKTLNAADYTLSGTLAAGSSAITVSYEGKTTIFTVTVTAALSSDITYTPIQTGGADGVADSTEIIFIFSASVDSLNLTANDITVGGTASKGVAALSGSGTSRTLPITVSAAGLATVSINKSGIEAGTKSVPVYKAGQAAPALTGITLNTNAVKKTYTQNEQLNLSGLVVTASYGNSSSAAVTGYTTSPANGAALSTTGTISVTVSYTEGTVTRTANFTVTVNAIIPNKTLTGITLNTNAVKKDYAQDEQLDLSGLVVTANYSDSSSAVVNGYTTSPANGAALSTTGTITVTVSYTEGAVTRIANFTVTVINIADGTPGLAFEPIGNPVTAYRVRKGSVTGGVVYIPASYNGLPVTEIGSTSDYYNCAFVGTSITAIHIPNSVTSIGYRAFSSCTGLTSINIPNSVTSIGACAFQDSTGLTSINIPNSVTYISNEAFSGCTSLTSVTIGEGVTTIGYYVFSGCASLTNIIIDNDVFATDSTTNWGTIFPAENLSVTFKKNVGDRAFSLCTRLTSVTISEGVTSIGERAFSGCASLTSITIPNSVTSIGDYAFYNCTGLISVTIGEGVRSIGSDAFSGCTGLTSITIPNSVTSIGRYAFYSCTSLTSITVPNSVTSIGDSAFSRCTSLTSINIPNSVTSIDTNAFSRCASLTDIIIDNDVLRPNNTTNWGAIFPAENLSVTFKKNVGNYAFYNCARLTSVTISEGVTSIGERAFSGCASLTSITIGEGVTSIIGDYVFSGCTSLTNIIIDNDAFTNDNTTNWGTIFPAQNLSVTFKKNVGDYAFFYCTRLTSVTIGEGVTSIGFGALGSCTGLTSINIPNSVTSIGACAFQDSTGLTSINIPNSVTSIGTMAFENCTGLTSITIPASVTSVGYSAFGNWTSSQTIYIAGYASQSAANNAWGSNWLIICDAVRKYWNGSNWV